MTDTRTLKIIHELPYKLQPHRAARTELRPARRTGSAPDRLPVRPPFGKMRATCPMPSHSLLDDMSNRLATEVLPALIRAASIDVDRFLKDLRRRGLAVEDLQDLRALDVELLDPVADSLIESSRRISAVSGVGLGMGGWIAIGPDIAGQLTTLLKMAQRLSLLHGIDFRTRSGEVLMWKAIADSVGVDMGREEMSAAWTLPARIGRTSWAVNPVVGRLAIAVIRRLALKLSTPLGRMVPLVGSGVGMWSNYSQMGRAGRRMAAFYRARRASGGSGEREELVEVEVVPGARDSGPEQTKEQQ